MLTGGVLPLDLRSGETLEGVLTRLREKGSRSAKRFARKFGVELDIGEDDVLDNADAVFVQIWLKDLLDAARRPPPALKNTDGEPLLLTTTRLPVAANAGVEISRRLDALDEWQHEPDATPPCWIWQPDDATPTIHATARLTDGTLVLESNSRARMERALALVRSALGSLVGTGLTSHEDPLQLLRRDAAHDPRESQREPSLTEPEVEAVVRQFKDAHYRRVLDEPVPMLANKTPRECARTQAGRARLKRWLKDLENGERHGAAQSGQRPYDFAWMRQELGL
jgi:hypothetical protein